MNSILCTATSNGMALTEFSLLEYSAMTWSCHIVRYVTSMDSSYVLESCYALTKIATSRSILFLHLGANIPVVIFKSGFLIPKPGQSLSFNLTSA